ncbi:MAG: N-acetyltransferase [Dehalococcoidales bacterium]|jgi:amino-acid N-acetyltransferase|nr:N-acetyltransferase [Dehalococcoidales bacterium]MDD5604705.1 N-acetyltransferase [Dehalococcoidales bacterium]MDX9985989.1 N-acetyltransferase [Dehalococcoidales bacterium]NLE90660.1 N-acetyltransferase [Dehalococcoidales bacterium]
MDLIQKATIKDAAPIHRLVNNFADKGKMLPRSLSEIYENIRDYYVIRQGDNIIACGALHVLWEDLAEIKSLAVTSEHQKQGWGDKIVRKCLEEARFLNIPRVFCLTYSPEFFSKCGFKLIDKSELPQKIWGECFKCPKFPDCDESALLFTFME